MSTTKTVMHLPREASGHEHYGRPLWELGEDGDMGVVVEGHGARALAAVNAYGREIDGPTWRRSGWAGFGRKLDVTQYWAIVFTTCGCTSDQHDQQHAHYVERAGTGCNCPHPGLPPCDRERFAWTVERVTEDTPGAVALTEVTW